MNNTYQEVKHAGATFRVMDNDRVKILASPDYNFTFRKGDGYFERYGATKVEDPLFSPIGPEILDIEISVNGCPNNCPFCYKGNTNEPATNMTLGQFQTILSKMPPTLTQVAFGITGIQTNPDFVPMLQHCRDHGVVPNFTLSGIDLTQELAEETAKLIGAVAVSVYPQDKNVCYETVKLYTSLGVEQTNIHLMVCQETLDFVHEVLHDIEHDPRLKKLNAVVFLGMKPKGRAKGKYTPLTYTQYGRLVLHCLGKEIAFGFDSCSAPKFEAFVRESPLSKATKKEMIECCESCESFGLFSAYINVKGDYYFCSFSEGEKEYKPLSVLECDNFLDDVWYHPQTALWRKHSLDTAVDGCRQCLIFPEINL